MNILQLHSGQNTETGDFVYRIKTTTEGLSSVAGVAAEHADLVDVSPDLLQDVPLLILHHLSDPDILPVISERKRRGLPTVYELADNFRFSHAHKTDFRRIGPPAYTVVIEAFIRRCDAIQVNNVGLEACCAGLNTRFIHVPNFVRQCSDPRPKPVEDRLTVGWGGSARHAEDMKHYAPAIIEWVRENPDVRLGIMATKSIRDLFLNLPADQVFFREPDSLDSYLAFLEELHVGLAPLIPTEFNACRSDVKYLEYASAGAVPVCSRFGPYAEIGREDESIVYFDNAKELVEKLDVLRSDAALRERIADGAQRWVAENRVSEQRHWQRVVEAYDTLHPGIFWNKPCERKFESTLPGTGISGLVSQAVSGRGNGHALSELGDLISSNFRNYHIHFFYGWALWRSGKTAEAFAAIKQALEMKPDSIHTLEFAARLHLLNGDFATAGKMIDSALDVEPGLPTLLAVKGQVLQLQGQHHQALQVLEECIAHAPQFIDALMASAQSAILLAEYALAELRLQQLRKLIPASADVLFYLALLKQHQADLDACKRLLHAALQLQPGHSKSKMLLERLQEDHVPA